MSHSLYIIRYIIIASILLFIPYCGWRDTVYAQVGTLYNGEQRLTSSFVHQVYQDKTGFIWVATNNGLNRYDGYSFITFNTDDGLSSEDVNCVIADGERNVYAGTTNGLFVKVKGRFHAIQNASTGKDIQAFVSTFYKLKDGTILFGTSGRGLWKVIDTDKAVNISNSYINFIKSIVSDNKGNLWIATEKRGIVVGRITGTADKPVLNSIKTYIPTSNFFFPVMTMGKDGTPFVGLYGGGLYRFDHQKHNFAIVPGTESLTISSIEMRKDGEIFLGTNGDGVKVFSPKTGEIRQANFTSNQLNMNRTKVVSILQDKNQNMWLGLFQKGVFMQRPHVTMFSSIGVRQGSNNPIGESCVMYVTKQKDGTVWVACDQDGLYKLDSSLKLIRHFAPAVNGLPTTILTMAEDDQRRLWIGSYTQGCGWIDTSTGSYHRASFSYGNAQGVFDIRCDYKGCLWIGTLGDGLKCYDPKTEKVTEYKSVEGKPGLINNYILQMEMSADRKQLFIGTATGLSCLDLPSRKWVKLLGKEALYPDLSINALRYSPTSGLWVGCPKGLFNIDLKNNKENKFTYHDGPTTNHVSSIEIEKGDYIWVSTATGLYRLNPKTKQINSFYTSDGTQGNEYSEGSSFCDYRTGMMLFGGTDGLTYFYPKNIKLQNTKFSIFLSSIEVAGERIKSFEKSGNYTICEGAVSECKQFDFSHLDNTISINFSTLSYSGTEHTVFSYSINGEEWISLPQGENTLTLSRMSPGDYHFQVKALDNGRESEIREFTITIHNAWYFTPFARFIYLLLILALVYWYIRNLKQKQQQELRLQQHMHAEELNEQKLQFFMNLSHEIRTPMTLIVTPIMKLIHEDKDAARQATYEVIKRNTERILGLINQILDIRKIDKGQMQMHMRETEIVPFIEDIMQMFAPHAQSKNITMSLLHPDSLPNVWIDRSNFDKVIINLLSNAFKYVKSGGNVEIRLSTDNSTQKGNCLTITVADDGEKIAEKALPHIFERFYQAANNVNSNKAGTGIGLHLVQSIVTLHHGNISVHNIEGTAEGQSESGMKTGVEFVVNIPLGSSHLTHEEIATWEEDKKTTIEEELHGAQALEQEDDEEETKVTGSNNNKRPIVAIVEDDDDIRNYLMSELSNTYRIIAFSDGAEALPAILREIPALIISDVMMPNMDGYTLCSRVKTNVNTNHIPVILLTAKSLDEDQLEGLESGADLFVSKPFNMDVLRRNIANLIASRHLMQNKYTGKEDAGAKIEVPEMESFDEKLLSRIMAVINDNLGNSDLNIDMICREVGISRVHLHRKMKELTNQTPHDFIRNLRMKQAAQMLSHKGQTVTEIMYRCGFSSATSFSTMFKKMYGMSPREYMKEHTGE